MQRAERPVKRRRMVDFGGLIPFQTIPSIVAEGFRELDRVFAKGNAKVLEHYHTARNCLERCLGDPICDVLLMVVLTFASSSVTPFVAPQTNHFDAGPRKEPALFAANLATRMLWFFRPDDFPWKQDGGMVLHIPEMTKKIGK